MVHMMFTRMVHHLLTSNILSVKTMLLIFVLMNVKDVQSDVLENILRDKNEF